MIVLLAWILAVVIAVIIVALVAFELLGRLRRFNAALAGVTGEDLPRVQRMVGTLKAAIETRGEPRDTADSNTVQH